MCTVVMVFSVNPSPNNSRVLTLSQMTNLLESSKLKEFADDNFKLNENGR